MDIFYRAIIHICLFLIPSLILIWYIDGQEKYRGKKVFFIGVVKVLFFCNKKRYIPSGETEKASIIESNKSGISIFAFVAYLVSYLFFILYIFLLLLNTYYIVVNNLYFLVLIILNSSLLIILILIGLLNENKLKKK